MNNLDLLTASYDYKLPKELIATHPIKPADSAKLLVYKRDSGEIIHATFRDILKFIPKETAVFINDTKVIKARIFGKKSSGGAVEVLILKPVPENQFLVMIRGRVKEGSILEFDSNLSAIVLKLNSDGSRIVKFFKDGKELAFDELVKVLEEIGHIPLPPYINRSDTKEDEVDYQTIFAKKEGSVAAPTASLHFTKELFEELKREFSVHTLTLHVGAGTFKPVEAENILEHPMHSEYYSISKESAKVIDSNQKILAIGTTATRTIEFYARGNSLSGECNLFLHPLNPPKRVDYLLTNFHLPKSTLIMLVSSFLGRETTLKLYNIAVENRYRFYSYGDAMLIL